MKLFRIGIGTTQILVWALIYALLVLYNVREDGVNTVGILVSTINIVFWITAMYSQAIFLVPLFFSKEKKLYYISYSIITLIVLVAVKANVDYIMFYKRLNLSHFYNLHLAHIAFVVLTTFLCFIIGFLLRISLDYINLLKHQEQLKNQHLQHELNLLKQQVQPHFIFNTLNNIYSLANRKSEKTPEMIGRLGDIMRYFVHDASRELVTLETELAFIRNYIALEQIRMVHPVNVNYQLTIKDEHILIPPMLFIPLIENYFKHGIDKTKQDNRVTIRLESDASQLTIEIYNLLLSKNDNTESGTGLKNLQKRLQLLFPEKHTFSADSKNRIFMATFQIHLS
jgi:hypothetical protein